MRILIITGIFPPDIGGPATYVPQIAGGLSVRGHEVTVLTLSDQLYHQDSDYPFMVLRLPRKVAKPWRQFLTISQILRLGRSADILFVNGLALEAVLANKVLRKPLVIKVVGDLIWERAHTFGWIKDDFETFQQKRYSLKIETLKALRSWWTRQADQVIVPSLYLAGWIQRWGLPPERVAVIYNAVEPAYAILPLPVPLETPIKVVTVGRFVRWKRLDRIFASVAKIPNLGLIIIGDGPERLRLVQLAASMGISERVYFSGQRDHEETLRLMAAADLFLLNSTYEGLPHVVLEAMALGLPVVATAVGGTPELIKNGETGILIKMDDDGSLLSTLERLIKDFEWRRRLGESARHQIEENFKLEDMICKTEALLYEVKK